MNQQFRFYFRVRYGECDAQKVVFNARYGDYIDIAVGEFFRALGYQEEMISAELDFQLVKQTTQWRAPARYDDILEAQVACIQVGTSSFTFNVEFRLAGETDLICESETVYVLIDSDAQQKRAVDEPLRSRLLAGAPGTVHDHAGFRSG